MITRAEIERQVLKQASDVFGVPVEELGLDSCMDDIREWDSFAHVALVIELEEVYGLELPPKESAYFEKLHDMVQALEQRLVL